MKTHSNTHINCNQDSLYSLKEKEFFILYFIYWMWILTLTYWKPVHDNWYTLWFFSEVRKHLDMKFSSAFKSKKKKIFNKIWNAFRFAKNGIEIEITQIEKKINHYYLMNCRLTFDERPMKCWWDETGKKQYGKKRYELERKGVSLKCCQKSI